VQGLRVIVWSADAKNAAIVAALRVGAVGFLSKDTSRRAGFARFAPPRTVRLHSRVNSHVS